MQMRMFNYEWMKGCVNEQTNKRKNEQMNEETNKTNLLFTSFFETQIHYTNNHFVNLQIRRQFMDLISVW